MQPYLVMRAIVTGEPDPVTGYLCNIKEIDNLLRERAIPLANRLYQDSSPLHGESLIVAIATDLKPHAPAGTRWVGWRVGLTPYLWYAVDEGAREMVQVTQSFEFAAAHRLHCPTLSDEENRKVFGKCNNPNGHGHNYQVEVTVEGDVSASTGVVLPVTELEGIVKQHVVDRFDHKHLNRDCVEFAELNPSVEHITRVIWSLLKNQFAPARLKLVRVYETPKTWAEYDGS